MVPLLLGPIGVQELLILLVIFVLLFGATKLPQIGRGLGEGIRNFKKGIKEDGSNPEKLDESHSGDRSASNS
jgi:sec-independent protein translocase protein TatA